MTLDNLLGLTKELDNAGTSLHALGGVLRFLQQSDDQQLSAQNVADLTNRSLEDIEPVLYRLRRLGILDSTGQDEEFYSLEESRLQQTRLVLDWMMEYYETDDLEALANIRVRSLKPLYTVPAGSDAEKRSNMSGQLLDIISRAEERIQIVVPFFSDAGVDTISGALAVASGEEVDIEILTRDLTMGSGQNDTYIESIFSEAQKEGDQSRVTVFEFDRSSFPENRLHAKLFVADSYRAFLGSANLTGSSLQSSLEAGIYLDGETATEISADLDEFKDSDLFVNVTEEYRT